jgi:hypothetical protein
MKVLKTSKKRNLPNPGPGRPKGCPNKLSRTTKENIEKVFEALGDWQGMKKWVELSPRNKSVFYAEIYPKLLPLDVQHSGPNGGPMVMIMSRPGK